MFVPVESKTLEGGREGGFLGARSLKVHRLSRTCEYSFTDIVSWLLSGSDSAPLTSLERSLSVPSQIKISPTSVREKKKQITTFPTKTPTQRI